MNQTFLLKFIFLLALLMLTKASSIEISIRSNLSETNEQTENCYYIKENKKIRVMAHVDPADEEYFISLNDESISQINIDGCDFKGKAVSLSLTYNKIKVLKIENQMTLTSLRLENNAFLEEIELRNIPNLKYLSLPSMLKTLSIDNLPADIQMTELSSLLFLTHLNVTKCNLNINKLMLFSLSYTENKGKVLSIKDSSIKSLYLSNKFKEYQISTSTVGELTLENKSDEETSISVHDSKFENLIFEKSTKIKDLSLSKTKIKRLEINCNKMQNLKVENSAISSLITPQDLRITSLYSYSNNEEKINCSNKIKINYIHTKQHTHLAFFINLIDIKSIEKMTFEDTLWSKSDRAALEGNQIKEMELSNQSLKDGIGISLELLTELKVLKLNYLNENFWIRLHTSKQILIILNNVKGSQKIKLNGDFMYFPRIQGENASLFDITLNTENITKIREYEKMLNTDLSSSEFITNPLYKSYLELKSFVKTIQISYPQSGTIEKKNLSAWLGYKNKCPVCGKGFELDTEFIQNKYCNHLFHENCYRKYSNDIREHYNRYEKYCPKCQKELYGEDAKPIVYFKASDYFKYLKF